MLKLSFDSKGYGVKSPTSLIFFTRTVAVMAQRENILNSH